VDPLAADGQSALRGSRTARALGVSTITVVLALLSIPGAVDASTAPAALDRDQPFQAVSEFVHDHADEISTQLDSESSGRMQALSSCHDTTGTDPVGDSSGPDVVSYRMSSDCSGWALDVATGGGWPARELDLFGMRIDIDYNQATGCLGGDYVAAVTHKAGLRGTMIRTPSCDDATWSFVDGVAASKASADTITLGFPATMIKNDESFRWYLGLSSVHGGVDFAPDGTWVAVNPEATAPTAPRALSATSGQRVAKLAWRAPVSPGGTTVSDYVVQRSADRGRTWSTLNDGLRTDRQVTVRRLTNGQRYRFRVAAANKAGPGPWSAVVTVVPATAPTAPRRLTGARARRAVKLAWLAPSRNGGAAVRDYVVQRSSNGGRTWRTVRDGVKTRRAATVTGLTSRTRYVFHVAAVNRAGRGPWSALVRATPR
jgi:hypothetical protein